MCPLRKSYTVGFAIGSRLISEVHRVVGIGNLSGGGRDLLIATATTPWAGSLPTEAMSAAAKILSKSGDWMFPKELKYMDSHEWAKREGDVITVGVSDYAQQEIQDVVYVELPEIGQKLQQKKEFGVIESVKAAFDIYAPVSGEVVDINRELEDTPENINEDPYGTGWIIKIRVSNPGEFDSLLSVDKYRAKLEAETET